MDVALLSTGSRCSAAVFSAFRLAAAARSIGYRREIAAGDLLSLSGSSIRCEGNRRGRPRRNSSSDRTSREANKTKDQTSYGGISKSPRQDEIIDLFRRIQLSISKGPKVYRKRSTSSTNEKKSIEPVQENFKVSRPLSKFVKKSPIPAPPTTAGSSEEVVDKSLLTNATDDNLDFQSINEMKLSELKELAKSRGVKGYSKLRKAELLELLKGLLQSSS